MEISAHDFLIVNGLIVIIIALSFALIRRSPRAPVKLKLTDRPLTGGEAQSKDRLSAAKPVPTSASPSSAAASSAAPRASHTKRPPGWDNYRPRANKMYEPVAPPPPREKALNVMFIWNGHAWDAYEVLGIPAGSSREAAQVAHQKAITHCDSETLPFLNAALDAILRS